MLNESPVFANSPRASFGKPDADGRRVCMCGTWGALRRPEFDIPELAGQSALDLGKLISIGMDLMSSESFSDRKNFSVSAPRAPFTSKTASAGTPASGMVAPRQSPPSAPAVPTEAAKPKTAKSRKKIVTLDMNKEFWNLAEVAKYWGDCSTKTITRMIEDDEIPDNLYHRRTGKAMFRFHAEGIRKFFRSRFGFDGRASAVDAAPKRPRRSK